ncbi:MAG: V-type ATPase subunit, partial [Oscillospiraceae bacterium]|nr:V-type ATPase subunit [Oscillospiraceae bacterium]
MKNKDTDYLYATMRVRANEKNLLTERDIGRMCEAKTASEAAKVLSDAGYGEISTGSFSEISDAIASMRKKTAELVSEICEKSAIAEVFALKYDFHNIKTVIKASLSGSDPQKLMSSSGTLEAEVILSAYSTGDVKALPEKMGRALNEAKEILSRTGDAALADISLDKAYFEMLDDAAQKSGSAFLCGYVSLLADTANLRTAVRTVRQGRDADILRRALVPGGKIKKDLLFSRDFVSACADTPLKSAAELGEAAANGGG